MRILLVEDDPDLGPRLARRLAAAGFAVDHARDGLEAADWPDLGAIAVIVLDLGLPGASGIDVLKAWRTGGVTTPVIVLTARGSWQEKVEGLEAGADDFVVKPVRSEELLARINAQIRRSQQAGAPVMRAGAFALDPIARTITRDGAPLALSAREYRLLELFLRRPGHVLAPADLLERLYPLSETPDLNALEVQISRLRRKIGREAIRTVRGLGYRFEP
ncbi:MAG: response regulator transcription factor [Sphingomonadaceae bacterium]